MADARDIRDWDVVRILTASSVAVGECWQMPDGRAAVYESGAAANSGVRVDFVTSGVKTMTKTSGFVALSGGRAYWDHSANACSYRKVSDRDFYLGRFAADAASTDTNCEVELNTDPPYDLDLARDPYITVLAGTPAAGGFGYPVRLGGATIFELTSTAEAQKVDALGVDGFNPLTANAIIEGAFRVISDGAGTVVDVSLGVASATHATDADSIAESIFCHLDANNVNINFESDDGTAAEVAATDSTIDYTEGSALSSRVEFWMDMRDPADVQIYVNGSLILGSTVFDVGDAAATWFLLTHVEKTSSTDTYKLAVDWLRARFAEQ